jgi:hypothetical protein
MFGSTLARLQRSPARPSSRAELRPLTDEGG